MNAEITQEDRKKIDEAVGYYNKKQYPEALEIFRKYAEADGTSAAYLGLMYENALGVEKDVSEAVRWYTIGAERGNRSAQYFLGNMYRWGKGVETDPEKAVQLYHQSASQGYPGAMNTLANCLRDGTGTGKDEEQAIEWYRKAIDLGNRDAWFGLGYTLVEGSVSVRDYAEGIKCYEKAEKNGSSSAVNNLGAMYLDGRGVLRDIDRAIANYEKACGMGNSQAHINLGNIYLNGQYREKDYPKALEYFEKAQKLGHRDAARRIERVRALMADDQEKVQKPWKAPAVTPLKTPHTLADGFRRHLDKNYEAGSFEVRREEDTVLYRSGQESLKETVIELHFEPATTARHQKGYFEVPELYSFKKNDYEAVRKKCEELGKKHTFLTFLADAQRGTVSVRMDSLFTKENYVRLCINDFYLMEKVLISAKKELSEISAA